MVYLTLHLIRVLKADLVPGFNFILWLRCIIPFIHITLKGRGKKSKGPILILLKGYAFIIRSSSYNQLVSVVWPGLNSSR